MPIRESDFELFVSIFKSAGADEELAEECARVVLQDERLERAILDLITIGAEEMLGKSDDEIDIW